MRKYLFLIVPTLLPCAAQAQEEPASVDTTITVIARGIDSSVEQVAEPISIIGEEEIRDLQGPDITRVLERLPGVTTASYGGPGGFTPVFVRGASSEQLLVLIDGVRVNDVAAPGGGFDFGNLLAGSIEKVELVRSPGSVVWGSDAIAGVLHLTTRVDEGLSASAEYGADDTIYTTLGGGIARERLEAGLTGSWFRTDGFSRAASGSEPDGFEQWQLAGRGRAEVAPEFWLIANGRYSEGELEQDGALPPDFVFGDTADFQDTRLWSGRLGTEYRTRGLSLRAGYALSDTHRLYTGESYGDFPYETQGRSERAELFARTSLWKPELAVDLGADREWNSFDDSGEDRTARTTSAHLLAGWYGSRLTVSAGTRYDDHSTFGGAWSFGANAAYGLAEAVRIRASYNEGFKAPTLFQSVSSALGNAALMPERSRSYDIGLYFGQADDLFRASLSIFRRDSDNLIDFVSCFSASDAICADRPFGTYNNVGRARAEGGEIEMEARPVPALRLAAVYSYVKAMDRTAGSIYEGKSLARRPRQALTASMDWNTPFGLKMGGDIRLVGDSFDDRANSVPLDGYVTADVGASFPLEESFELFARVENLFDADYRTVAGYATQGQAAYIGARVRM